MSELVFSSAPGLKLRRLDKELDTDLQQLATIIRDAFHELEVKSGFREELSDINLCLLVLQSKFDTGIVVINEEDGGYVGINFLTSIEDKNPFIRGIGPIAVKPDHQGRGIGRLLMNGVKELSFFEGANTLRLTVDAHNPVSYTLYSSLGYSIRNSLSILHLPKLNIPIDPELDAKYIVKDITPEDVPKVGDYMRNLVGFSRELETLWNIQYLKDGYATPDTMPVYAEDKEGNVVGYSLGVNVLSFSGADNSDIWKHIFSKQINRLRALYTSEEEWIEKAVNNHDICFAFPASSYPKIFTWILSFKPAIMKNMYEMTFGEDNTFPPSGKIYFPSVMY